MGCGLTAFHPVPGLSLNRSVTKESPFATLASRARAGHPPSPALLLAILAWGDAGRSCHGDRRGRTNFPDLGFLCGRLASARRWRGNGRDLDGGAGALTCRGRQYSALQRATAV